MLVEVCKVGWAWLQLGSVGRPSQIADHNLRPRVCLLEHRFEISEMLLSFEQRVADQCDARIWLKLQWQAGRYCCSRFGPGRGLLVDAEGQEIGIVRCRRPLGDLSLRDAAAERKAERKQVQRSEQDQPSDCEQSRQRGAPAGREAGSGEDLHNGRAGREEEAGPSSPPKIFSGNAAMHTRLRLTCDGVEGTTAANGSEVSASGAWGNPRQGLGGGFILTDR